MKKARLGRSGGGWASEVQVAQRDGELGHRLGDQAIVGGQAL
jgi:hypothetical protein